MVEGWARTTAGQPSDAPAAPPAAKPASTVRRATPVTSRAPTPASSSSATSFPPPWAPSGAPAPGQPLPPSDHDDAARGDHGLARHVAVARAGEEADHLGDVGGRRHPAEGRAPRQILIDPELRRFGVSIGPGETALTRMLSPASSSANDLVK